jgi:hypothetical protein
VPGFSLDVAAGLGQNLPSPIVPTGEPADRHRISFDAKVSKSTWTAAANGSNRIAIGCPPLLAIDPLTCVNDLY